MGRVDKTVGFTFEGERCYEVRVEIKSLARNILMADLDKLGYAGRIYLIKVEISPKISLRYLENQPLIFVLLNGDEQVFGYLKNNELTELPQNRFVLSLNYIILEALMLYDDHIVYHAGSI